jgi:hypothetical protein
MSGHVMSQTYQQSQQDNSHGFVKRKTSYGTPRKNPVSILKKSKKNKKIISVDYPDQ